MNQQPPAVKIVVIGDGFVGKTSILISYIRDQFQSQYQPTVFQSYSATVKVGKNPVNLGLWDTAGQQEYQSLRLLSYPNADAFLIVFSVSDRNTFINAYQKWYPEVQKMNKTALKIFVGNKIDVRTMSSISSQQAENTLKKQIGNHEYYQCSALTQDGLKYIFDKTLEKIVSKKQNQFKIYKNKQDKCCSVF